MSFLDRITSPETYEINHIVRDAHVSNTHTQSKANMKLQDISSKRVRVKDDDVSMQQVRSTRDIARKGCTMPTRKETFTKRRQSGAFTGTSEDEENDMDKTIVIVALPVEATQYTLFNWHQARA